MQKQTGKTNSQPHTTRLSVPRGLAWLLPRTSRQRLVFHATGTALLLGLVLAYEPALGDGTVWTLPYTGSASVSQGSVFSVTNSYTDNLYYGSHPSVISAVDQSVIGYGVYSESHGAAGVYALCSGTQGFGVQATSTGAYGTGIQGICMGTQGVAVSGYHPGNGIGVGGSSQSNVGVSGGSLSSFGVYGRAGKNLDESGPVGNGSTVTFSGVYGTMNGPNPVGVWGNVIGAFPAMYGTNGYGPAIQGVSGTQTSASGTYGVYGVSYGSNSNGQFSAAGVYGVGNTTTGVAGMSGSGGDPAVYGYNSSAGTGVWGQSAQGNGVYGITNRTDAAGVFGTNSNGGAAVIGLGNSTQSPTGYFRNDNGFNNAIGLQGQCNTGLGVVGYGRVGVYGAPSGSGGYAGYFQGDVQATGTISGAAKHFKIDHPLDPAHKYLVHASVESSEMLNIYRGNVTLDSDGKAVVDMPQWFQSENGDCRYQLTCVGGYAPVYIDRKMEHNQFAIGGGKPGLEVSWQVTAVRQDAYAQHHPLQVEQEKSGTEAGKYLNPEDFGKPREQGIGMIPLKQRMLRVAPPPTRFHTSMLRSSPRSVNMPKPPVFSKAPSGSSPSR